MSSIAQANNHNRIKVCMIVPQKDVKGGIAAVTSGYYGSRLEQDFEVTYVESYCDGSRWKKLRKALKAYHTFRCILHQNKPDLVHIHSSFGPSFYRKLPFINMSYRQGIPVINHIHGSAFDEFYEQAPAWKKKLVRLCYGKCRAIVVLTDGWKKKIGEIVPEDRIHVIPNYAREHPEMLTPRKEQFRFHRRQIVFLGMITPGKGSREMPAVIRKVLEKWPDARFVICGIGETQQIISQLPESMRSHVMFPGWVGGSQKEQILEESMLFFLPSHMEAMPMSALDAMGYGLPVVSTNAGGIPFVVKDQEDGALTNVGDAQAMAAAIIHYLSDYELWKKTSVACLNTVHQKFSLSKHLTSLEKLYRYCTNEGDGSDLVNDNSYD